MMITRSVQKGGKKNKTSKKKKTPTDDQKSCALTSAHEGVRIHLIVEAGEVGVPSEHNPALILSLPDQDLENLQQRKKQRE